ncbi:putative membrane protein [Methanolinea mesophila]|uniref:tripartite tricarboxylate transporter permease n=1 Tax=Methanolinea mesophila TaxID=547055 RepID=UPI001AE1113D|nr:tripartite tricarboxylate transporter permease [Methanolinea mesophila]MBP1928553.1 putative membrane protein [Methanolinea mesophila]
MWDILAGVLVGVLLGTVSGLIPGIHANTMAGILLAAGAALVPVFGPSMVAVAMISALVTHTFLDAVPSTFLGVPDPDTAIAVLPAHALCMQGKGEEAVRISALGSALGATAGVPLVLVFVGVIPIVQGYIDWGIGILLVGVMGYLVLREESPAWCGGIFIVSGILGLFSFGFSYLGGPGESSAVLMPLLSGLFGVPLLLTAAPGPVPPQSYSGLELGDRELRRSAAGGTIAGTMVGWLPGLSNATANAVLASAVNYRDDGRSYLLATGAANTANAFLGIAAFYAVARTRNGVMAAIAGIEPPPVTVLLAGAALAAMFAFLLCIWFSGKAGMLTGLDRKRLNTGVIVFLVLLSFMLAGPFGLAVLILASIVGFVPDLVNVPRVHCMGAVAVPVILYSFGLPLL